MLAAAAARGGAGDGRRVFRARARPTTAARRRDRRSRVVDALESCCARGLGGLLLLIEEPELYLRPQAQRYLYRVLREFSSAGNQVIYSTHSPAFLNVARLDELVFVERSRARERAPCSPSRCRRTRTSAS